MKELKNLSATVQGTGAETKKRAFECFIEVFPQFAIEARQKNLACAKKLQEVKEDVRICGETYGENKEYKTKDFLIVLINFASSIRVAIQ